MRYTVFMTAQSFERTNIIPGDTNPEFSKEAIDALRAYVSNASAPDAEFSFQDFFSWYSPKKTAEGRDVLQLLGEEAAAIEKRKMDAESQDGKDAPLIKRARTMMENLVRDGYLVETSGKFRLTQLAQDHYFDKKEPN